MLGHTHPIFRLRIVENKEDNPDSFMWEFCEENGSTEGFKIAASVPAGKKGTWKNRDDGYNEDEPDGDEGEEDDFSCPPPNKKLR